MANDIKQTFTVDVDGVNKLDSYTNKLKENEQAGEKLEKTNKGLTASFGKLAGGIATTAVAIKSAKIAWQLGELGASVMTVDKNFQQFAQKGGKSAISMMADLRKASGGLMDDMFLQQQAMKAMISGIEFDDMIVAMEYVRKYALATGDDVNMKMQTVMTGLARGSAQFMDDVGIQVMGAEDVVGATIAQMKEKMGDFADTTNDTSTKIASMKANFENLKQEVGTGLVPVIDELLGKFEEIGSERVAGAIITATKYLSSFVVGVAGALDTVFTTLSINFLEVAREMTWVFSMMNKFNPILHKQAKQAGILSESLQAQSDEEKESLKDRIAGYGDLINSLHKTDLAVKEVSSTIGSSGSSGTLTGNVEESNKALEKKKVLLGELATVAIPEYMSGTDALTQHIINQKEEMEAYADSITVSQDEAFGDGFRDKMNQYVEYAQVGANSVDAIFTAVHNKRMNELNYETQKQKESIESSTMGEKRKQKAIAEIEEKARKEAHKIRMQEWKTDLIMSIANTALGVTNQLSGGDVYSAVPRAIAVGAMGAVNTGIIASNKPKFYYGSRDASGAYSEVGGNSQGDQIQANVRSGELIVQAGRDAQVAKNALNGVKTTNTSSNTLSVNPTINISGNADESLIRALPNIIVDTIQNAQFNGMFNPAVSNVF